MKIVTKTGNLFTHVNNGHIVHGCNAQGVMSSGFALGVKRIYPGAYNDYMYNYQANGLILGQAYYYKINEDLMIWNAITQDGFGGEIRNTSYDAIQNCFACVETFVSANHGYITSPKTKEIHIPLIGAARGGGNWEIIREIIEQTVTFPVTLWLPDDTVDTK